MCVCVCVFVFVFVCLCTLLHGQGQLQLLSGNLKWREHISLTSITYSDMCSPKVYSSTLPYRLRQLAKLQTRLSLNLLQAWTSMQELFSCYYSLIGNCVSFSYQGVYQGVLELMPVIPITSYVFFLSIAPKSVESWLANTTVSGLEKHISLVDGLSIAIAN